MKGVAGSLIYLNVIRSIESAPLSRLYSACFQIHTPLGKLDIASLFPGNPVFMPLDVIHAVLDAQLEILCYFFDKTQNYWHLFTVDIEVKIGLIIDNHYNSQ